MVTSEFTENKISLCQIIVVLMIADLKKGDTSAFEKICSF